MIIKDLSCPNFYRLCVIHLYKNDLNLLIGLYFKKLQQQIEDRKLLNDCSYGGQPNWCVIDTFVVDFTPIEVAMITRHPIIDSIIL